VVLRPGQQPTVAYELLKSEQAQWAPNIPPAQYAEAKQNPALTMYEWTAANGSYRVLEFNLARDFLKDKRVREALARAVNRQDLIQVAENNLGAPQFTFLNPANVKWYNPNVEQYGFDLARARQLLQDAGYTLNGGALSGANGQPVRLQVLYPNTSNPRAKIAAYLQQQYKQLGIQLEVKGLDFSAFTDEVKQKRFDLSLGTYGGGSIDPDLGAKPQLLSDGQQNVTSFNNPAVDDLLKKGAVELDDGKRKAIYDQLQQLVNQELPEFYLYSPTAFSPMSKRVQGVRPNKLDSLDYNDALTTWSLAQ
jgi:peptide/nickel transport system substrate-binding protein